MTESDQVRAIRLRYRRSLEEKAQVAISWREKLDASAMCEDEFSELAAWLHKLAGSAGMYQYEKIAATAREIMAMLDAGPNSHSSFRPQFDVLVAQLRDPEDPVSG